MRYEKLCVYKKNILINYLYQHKPIFYVIYLIYSLGYKKKKTLEINMEDEIVNKL